MIKFPIDHGFVLIDEFEFKVGDLVSTILGDYGIIVKIGKHAKYNADKTEYYHVLIDEHIRYFVPFALIKIKNKKNLDNNATISYTTNRSLKKQ